MIRRGTLLSMMAVALSCLGQAHNTIVFTTTARVDGLAVAQNGKIAAGWCEDRKIRIWNLSTGQVVRSLEPSDKGVSQVCALSNLPCGLLLSQDGRWLFFGDSEGKVHVWDSSTGDLRFETALTHYISTAALSRDGTTLAVAATGEPADIFDLRAKRLRFRLTSDFSGPMALAFSPNGSLIASADTDTVIRVFDVHTGKRMWEFDELTLEPFAVDFTADGKFVLAGGPNKSLILLDASSGDTVRSYAKQKDIVRYLQVSPSGSAVAAFYFNENGANIPAPVIVFDISSGNVLWQWEPDTPIIGGGWISTGQLLVATATDHALLIRALP